ncbi:2OG-Fe dioxygenase family protein [Lysobacter sp. F6437]|uniref:2OG-Fe dioxygenase family protein n=1 Tax=Lysobacter sp. F6437 TaxID=3459296 RepID=UPI00403DF256
MSELPAHTAQSLEAAVRDDGFAFVGHAATRTLLEGFGGLHDWDGFVASWNGLGVDTYLAATGRQRRRRHCVFSASPGAPVRPEPHQPHYQSVDYNRLQGGIERWFEPVLPEVAAHPCLSTIIDFSRAVFEHIEATPPPAWKIEVHQFRIEADAGNPGQPTPEGMHRDGVDYVLVLLIDRENIASGTTTIHAGDGRELGSFTLTRALDAALVDDARVFHGVTAVTPLDPTVPSHRDVLVVTFRAKPLAPAPGVLLR